MKKEIADKMTVQALMDYSVQKIVEQGKQCVAFMPFGSCAYSNGEGNHCAIGWLLEKDPNCEGALRSLIQECGDLVPEPVKENFIAFTRLQEFHDVSAKSDRENVRVILGTFFKINTSGKYWRNWVEMGT